MAVQRPVEPSVGRISEERPEGGDAPPVPPHKDGRKSLSLFPRRTSMQKGETTEAAGRWAESNGGTPTGCLSLWDML